MIGETSFDLDRQMRFASLSGDHNPIHVDAIAVRRTLPGRLVIHGVHVLLWALDRAAETLGEDRPAIARIRIRFLRFTHVGDRIAATVTARSDEELRMRIDGDGTVRVEIRIAFGAATAEAIVVAHDVLHSPGIGPLDHRVTPIDGRCGQVAFTPPSGGIAADFPRVAAWIGAERIDALAAATRLVGMIHPGLHSVLGGIDVRTMPGDGAGALSFEMGELRHGQIDATVSGGGIVGVLDCRVPNPPVPQPSCAALRGLVAPGRYAGAQVLVVGGARGLGEAGAKLLALGGADVVLTYRDGAADAEAVAADIRQAGGACTILPYDADGPVADQLGDLAPTHACWCATPVMARSDGARFDEAGLAACRAVLLYGFAALATVLHARRPDVRMLYPSAQWIEAPPAGLADYLAVKAEAEALARSLEAALPGLVVLIPRLPAMATDQTARRGLDGADAAATILPHLDRLIRGG